MENDQQKIKIICVDAGRELALQVRRIYSESQLYLAYERNIEDVVDRFEHESFDMMLFSSSVTHQHPSSALEILEIITAKCPETQILFFTHPKRLKIANQALRAGAFHYSLLPVGDNELRLLIETAMEKKPQLGLNLLLRSEVKRTTFEQMVGSSTSMHEVYRQIRQAAATDIPVLISGETGTGKELAAKAIHELSDRTNDPYIPVHIGSLPSDLVASELFGHEAGAFTGANELRKGCFELAAKGTIFLDEIATIDQKMQVSLLRLLETKSFHRLGSQDDIDVDVRVIAASNADLMSEIRKGRFREDLYYRLDVLHIIMPPLRDRHGDLNLLVDHFIKQSCEEFQKVIRGISTNFFHCVDTYSWPGNVRELKNVIQRAVINCQEDILDVIHLPERLMNSQYDDITIPLRVGMCLADVEKEVIIRTLEYTRSNRTRAAEILGISRRALYNKLQKLDVD